MSGSAANRYLRTEFLHALAHAIRTPLDVLQGVVRELHEGQAHEHAMLLAMAERNLARLTVLGERLDWVAELEEGARTPEVEPCDAASAVDEAVKRLHAPPVPVEVAIARGAAIRADRTMLRRALELVLDNAVRFARSQVCVSLDARDEAQCAIIVRDDGPGIAEAALEALFDRYRSGRSRGADHDLALGLSLARDYMRGMGGDLALSTGPEGTLCRLSLPRVPPGTAPR